MNTWDDADNLYWLPFQLSGKAQTESKRLTPDLEAEYKAAKETLEKHFEAESKRTL